jgi:hypothetical protein
MTRWHFLAKSHVQRIVHLSPGMMTTEKPCLDAWVGKDPFMHRVCVGFPSVNLENGATNEDSVRRTERLHGEV